MRQELIALREEMRTEGVDAYLIKTEDQHGSEYVAEHFKTLQYISGFTGENGSLLVSFDGAWLFTDGRFFLQAEDELKGSGISLMKMGEKDVPSLREHLLNILPPDGVLGLDGKCVSYEEAELIRRDLTRKNALIKNDIDLCGRIWKSRPGLPGNKVWRLSQKWSGKDARLKLSELRDDMKKALGDLHIICSLTDISWLLNLRGSDVLCTPVFMAFLLLDLNEAWLYTNEQSFSEELISYLEDLKIHIRPYEKIYEDIKAIKNKSVILSFQASNDLIVSSFDESVILIDKPLMTARKKAIKNETEVANMKRAHVIDGIIMTRFIYFLSHAFDSNGQLTEKTREVLKAVGMGRDRLTELSAMEYLDSLRRAQEGFIDLSFPTISAYGPHAALPHYAVSSETDTEIEAHGLYLVDSGGHYLYGTTDITRTVAMGPITDEERRHFTRVLQGMLRVADALIPEGAGGCGVDFAARELLWREGLDYSHGTGHGVGYLLSVHEGPNAIRSSSSGNPKEQGFAAGMITSDEPGIYVEGLHGIRLENLTVCEEALSNKFGTFLKFSFLTLCPIDKKALDPSLMEERDIKLLDSYHRKVYEALHSAFEGEVLEWFKEACAPLMS